MGRPGFPRRNRPLYWRAMPFPRRAALLGALPLLLLAAAPAAGWGPVGHELAAEAAVEALPECIPYFFREARERLVYLSNEPDRIRQAPSTALSPARTPDHYVNLERLDGLDFPPDRNAYVVMLLGAPPFEGAPRLPLTVGFGPYTVAEHTEELAIHWAFWHLLPKGSEARVEEERAIVETAGLLGHFVADLANPHHTTLHHNGWIGDNPDGLPTDPGTHARFEHLFVGRVLTLDDVRPWMRPLRPVAEPYLAEALRLTYDSYGHLRRLYLLDRDGAFTPGNEETPAGIAGREFAARRLAEGASTLRDLWVAAYKRGVALAGARPALPAPLALRRARVAPAPGS